ncbi:MAG: WxcM-like domain-containing protein [Bacteroidia bacterium]|nr:WxcM-like domain-containing protein [Bacteroidia bacterium]
MNKAIPHIIKFPKIGDNTLGYITKAENSELPFQIKRVYWTYHTPKDVIRGHHSHKQLQQIIIATSGTIIIEIENILGYKQEFILDSPDIALYIPPNHWRKIKFYENTVLLCLASEEYDEKDYIRDYTEFKKLDE